MSLCVLLLLSAAFLQLPSNLVVAGSEREALEIIIGGGGYTHGPAPSPPDQCPPPPPPEPECPPPPPRSMTRLQKARNVLLKFTRLIDDPTGYTRNWKESTKDTCKFKGVKCDRFPDTRETIVTGVDLNGARISGLKGKDLSLSASGILNMIPELTFFHVNSNNFSGSIPNEIINYKYFFELDLSNNKLEGEFPKQVLQSKQLVFLDLRFNNLHGPIPPQLFKLDVEVIFINNNYFSGCLPDNFGSTPARYLTFAHNQLSGGIPTSIGKASKTLTEVLFLGNKFEGCLPFEIGYLRKATVFDVSKNLLTGPIPLSFGCLERIEFLNLEENQFYGSVPEMVCQLGGVRKLSLSDNYFTEVGPECRKLIKCNVLDVSNNCIQGLANQKSHQQCSEFFSKVKPCPNPDSLNYIPCSCNCSQSQSQSQSKDTHTAAAPQPPLTYKSLKPHR